LLFTLYEEAEALLQVGQLLELVVFAVEEVFGFAEDEE
jgi:hypothetical protein